MGDKISFGAGVPHRGADDFSLGNVPVRRQALRAVPNVLVLVLAHPARLQGQIRGAPLQGLNARFFIRADGFQLLRFPIRGGALVNAADFRRFLFQHFRATARVEPALYLVWFHVALLLKKRPIGRG